MHAIYFPRLPNNPVHTVILSGEYPWPEAALLEMGLQVIPTRANLRLPKPVRFHPDMQICDLGRGRMFVLKGDGEYYRGRCARLTVDETQNLPSAVYPGDVLCNCLILGGCLFGNLPAVDPHILQAAQLLGLNCVHVNQGYAACSVCVVTDSALITADCSIADAAGSRGFDVLKIAAGDIRLPGYDSGLIGGCCGKIARDKLVFTGSLRHHASGDAILDFLRKHHVMPIELTQAPLLDIGGLIPIYEQ